MNATDARAARIGLVWLAWKAAHGYADHIGQVSDDAKDKGKPGWQGRAACARHVADLTATKLAALGRGDRNPGSRPGAWRSRWFWMRPATM